MERKIVFSIGEYYHVYNRGVEKRDIFLSDKDYKRFQTLLYAANSSKPLDFKYIQGLPLNKIDRGETLVDLGVYCLMPNHFHLLIKEKGDGGISKFISKLTTAYSMYFNKKQERSGRLFQGTFQAKHVDGDDYLKYLFAYIHLNPIKLVKSNWLDNKIDFATLFEQEKFFKNYKFSSGQDYFNIERIESQILNKAEFPEYFSSPKEFSDFLHEWLEINSSRVTLEDNSE